MLYSFRARRRMGNASLDADLLQQTTATKEVVLRNIFQDLQKAYKALRRDRCLNIMVGYCVGPRAPLFLWV